MRIHPNPKEAYRRSRPVEKVNSGLRVQSASDESPEQAIGERLRSQMRLLSRSSLRGQDALSLVQTGGAALKQHLEILQHMSDLAVQALRDDLDAPARLDIQKEVDAMRDEINRISRGTEFNTRRFLDGSQTATISSNSPFVQEIVTGSLREAVQDYGVSISLLQAGSAEMQRSRIQLQTKPVAKLAGAATPLQNILAFQSSSGTSFLDASQRLSLQGNGRSVEVKMNGQMTFGQLASTLQTAIESPAGLGISGSRVEVISTALTGVAGMGGYLRMTSGFPGKDAMVSILGDSALIEALGFSSVRAAEENRYAVTVRNSQGSASQGQAVGNRVAGLLEGVDLLFASQAAQVAGTMGLEPGIHLSADETFTLKVAAAAKRIPVTLAQGNWTLTGLARSIQAQMDAVVNGVETVSGVTTSVIDGQIRIAYEAPPTVASTGNDISLLFYDGMTLNLANGRFPGFATTALDGSKVQWGFSRFFDEASGIASGTSITIKIGDGHAPALVISVLSSPGTFGPGSRVVADLIPFANWQHAVNDLLLTHSVRVRLDQVGETLAFTALRVGREHRIGENPIESRVVLTGLNLPFTRRFGFDAVKELAAQGSGDTNFKLHAISHSLQHQVEAESDEVLKMGFADMGATALGIDRLNVTTIPSAVEALIRLDKGTERVFKEREKLNTLQNGLAESIRRLQSAQRTTIEAALRIQDVVMARKMIDVTRKLMCDRFDEAMMAQATIPSVSVFELVNESAHLNF